MLMDETGLLLQTADCEKPCVGSALACSGGTADGRRAAGTAFRCASLVARLVTELAAEDTFFSYLR